MMSFDKTRVRILIVDDEESIRTVIGLALKEDGWTVDMVSNGKLGLEALTQKPYHIVMSDIQMPEMTGIEFLEAAKQKFPNTEFLVMTSNASLETAMQAIKLGAYDYLTKPFEDVSVISKKMGQVSEKILLRQQNNELLKRLKKASQDLKSLFDFGSQLNGLLDEKSLHEAVKTWIPKIFQDSTVSSFWFQNKSEKWELVQQSSEKISFEAGRTFESVEAIRTELSSLRSVRELSLKYENETSRLFIFEGLSPELADLFSQELQVCFEKVMRHQDVVSLASRDGLTRLYNHRFFQDRLRGEMSLVKRQSSDLSVILVDVDHFKKFNDTYGHPAGDQLLKELAALFDQETSRRESDVVARYGGEEFVFLLPFTDYSGAKIKAERIRDSVQKYIFKIENATPVKVTISLGFSTFPQHAVTPGRLVEFADKALYEAKARGRNCVVGYEEIKQTPVSAPASEPRTTLGAVLEKSPEAKAVENVVAAAVVMNTAQVTELPPIVVEPEVEILAEIAEAIPEPVPKVEVAAPKVSEAPKPEVIVTASSEAPKVETTSTDASQAEPQKEKPKLKKKTLGPTVDIDDLCSSIDAVLDHPVENDGEIRAVLFANSPEETIEKVKKEKNGTGTEG